YATALSSIADFVPERERRGLSNCIRGGRSRDLSMLRSSPLECRRRIDPQQPAFEAPGISPAVRRGAFKIQAVAGLEAIVHCFVQPNLKLASQDMKKLLALVRVRLAAAPAGFHAEEVRLHGGISPSEKFHAHARVGLQNSALVRTHELRIFATGLKQRK